MAYVIRRRRGRFEIRESVDTPNGPRSRSLANFAVLTDAVLAKAAARASRPFVRPAVVESARRAGAPVQARDPYQAFTEASRRMGASEDARRPTADPGRELIQLLAFADAVARATPPRPRHPLEFPVLARLTGDRA